MKLIIRKVTPHLFSVWEGERRTLVPAMNAFDAWQKYQAWRKDRAS